MRWLIFGLLVVPVMALAVPIWEEENPIRPIPKPPLGISGSLEEQKEPPTPERVRLGRWLFYDKRLSKAGDISCATCHRPEHAFSEPTPVSTGHQGAKTNRKSPTFVNAAFALFPHFFWDGRAASLEEQALGPIQAPGEMGNTLEGMVATLSSIAAYKPYFKEAFGTEVITHDRVAKAIADYERTRMSGNSPYDRWKAGDENAVNAAVKRGEALHFGKAECAQCHVGENFTDSQFHNLGIGWNKRTKSFADIGRAGVTKKKEDTGAFKTPTLRSLKTRGPYMHDGSLKDLTAVVEHYNKGGNKNPYLSPKVRPLKLTKAEVKDLVAFLEALEGTGFEDKAPTTFPH
jgi:cytochrome c peroxidase